MSAPVLAPEAAPARPGGTWRVALRRLLRRRSALAGGVIVLLFTVVALAAPLLTPYEPGSAEWAGKITPSSVPGPGPGHLLGLDSFGSDLFTQLVYGARQSLVIGVTATGLGLLVGALVGLLAGGLGGWVDTLAMRVTDVMLSIPALLLAVSVAAVMGRSPVAVMIAIAAAQVPVFARLLRGSMLAQRGLDYVVAARSVGVPTSRIVFGQMLPNSVGPVIVQATLVLATATIEVAALSFLGLGQADPTVAEWGRMLVKAQARLESAPHLALLPGACIAVTALGFTLVGEALREVLDPKTTR